MRPIHRDCLRVLLALALTLSGCGLIASHIDCTEVAQQQRSGASNQEIASSMGYNVADVESCSDTTPKREASNSDYDQPLMPNIQDFSGAGIPGAAGGGAGAIGIGGVALP